MNGIILSLILAGSVVAHAAPTFSDDIPSALKQQILQDLDFVKSIDGNNSSALYKQIFAKNNLNGADLMAFFGQRILSFGKDSCGGNPAVGACVMPSMSSNTMWITPNYEKNNIPQIFRISIIFHESRHTEGQNDNWYHEQCPTPYRDDNGKDIVGIISGLKMEGHPACDITPLGAYGLQAVLLKNIEKNCANCSEKVKMDAKLFGDDGIYRISDLQARKQLKNDR